jgi:hypothetical protein
MKDALANHLEVWGFEKGITLFSDGSLGFGLLCTPVDTSCWDEERANAFADRVAQFLNGLPVGLDLQFVQDIEPGNSALIEAHRRLSGESKNEMATALCKGRADLLLARDAAGEMPVHSLKLFVRKPLHQGLTPKPKIFSREKKFEAIAEERLEQEIRAIDRIRENLLQGLRSLEIDAQAIDVDETVRLLYAQWNPGRGGALNSYDPEDIRGSILFSDVGVSLDGFSIGTKRFAVLSLKILPDQTYSCMAASLRELPFRSRLFTTVHVPDQMKEIESLQTQRRIAYSMAVGKKSGVSDIESTAKFQDLETLLEQMIARGEKVFHVAVNVLLQGNDTLDLDSQVSEVLAKFREIGGAEAMQETLAAFDIFSQVALPNVRSRERVKKVKTTNLADLVPLYGPARGHATPRVLLRSRMGSLFALDFFDSSLSNANQLVSGGSGAGKSALTNILLLQMLKENPKVFFVDIGGSYRKLCENLSGEYIELGVGGAHSVNPFDLAQGETKPSSHKVKFLLGLVELMTKEEGAERLPKLASAEIEDAIRRVFELRSSPRLSDLRLLLLEHKDPEIQRYGKVLSTWCGESPYGLFLDRETTVLRAGRARDLVAFDLKGLETYPDLQAVSLYLITDLVWREIQSDRSRMKFLVFDECWKLLKDEAGLAFMEEVFRTFRKYYASAIAISQDLNDFLNSKIASALVPNCAIKWILMQNQSELSKMQAALGLNETEIALIRSLRQEKGKCSEAFLLAGNSLHAVTVIEPTPLELWLATTDPRDLGLIERTTREHPERSRFEILRLLSEKYPHGAARGAAA